MPLPLIIGGASVVVGAIGVGKGIKAVSDNSRAGDINKDAQILVDEAKKLLDVRRDNAKFNLEELGRHKLHIYEEPMKRFVDAFGKLKYVKLTNFKGLEDFQQFKMERQTLADLQRDCALAGELAGGVVSGTLAGGLMAFGAYSAATMFATASTGTAIATLSGAAATNATLAFFGGGALAAGGLGVAGGMAVLGGIVAGPALAIAGLVMGNKAEANLNDAYANRTKAKEIAEELKTMRVACDAIAERASNFSSILDEIEELFEPQIYSLLAVIRDEGENFRDFSEQSKEIVAATAATAMAIKALLDTPIITQNGTLAVESEYSLEKAKQYLLAQSN